MYISAAIARGVVAVATRQGASIDDLLAASSIGPELLADPAAMIPAPDFDRLVKAAIAVTGDGALGLRLGSTAPLGMLNVVGHLVSNATTLREAFESFRRFIPLIVEDARYEIVDGDPVAAFCCDLPASDPEIARFQAELTLAFVVRFAREALATHDKPTAVQFAHPAPPYHAEYLGVFGCPVRFSAPRDAILFPRVALDTPILLSDRTLAETLRDRAEQLLRDRATPEELPGRVYRMLRDAPTLDGIGEREVARWLRTTPRTLRRRLAVHGRPFSSVLDDVRRDRAIAGLRRADVALKELAIELGFSEPSALHRAFKRWTGATIGEYRRRVAAP